MTEQTPDLEPDFYYLTRWDLEEYYDAIAHMNGKPEADRMWARIERNTHSRTHTPAHRLHPQQDEYLLITDEELLIVEHGCIYPDKNECVGNHCKYHDPNPSFRDNIVCLLNEHDVADAVRSRPAPAATPGTLDLNEIMGQIEQQAVTAKSPSGNLLKNVVMVSDVKSVLKKELRAAQQEQEGKR